MWQCGFFPYLNFNPELDKYYSITNKLKHKMPYSNVELSKIKDISTQYGAKFILSSIPEVFHNSIKTTKDFSDLFEGLEYIEMPVKKSNYSLKDAHYNEEGHKSYADFLMKHIERK
jgi:hypothetical protein